MKDLTNIAYSDEYITRKSNIIDLAYNPNNKTKETEIIENDLKRVITEYRATHNDKKYFCAINKVYNTENTLLFEYFNLDHHSFFCTKITYNSGKQYLFYKADLYGYSVFSIDTKETFDYYPKYEGETFIGTDIYFNSNNSVFAVEGCYWACPVDTFLIKIDNPLEQFTQYVNTHLIIEGDYDKYDDTNFVEWIGNDLKLKCCNIEAKPYKDEIIILSEKEYMKKMVKI